MHTAQRSTALVVLVMVVVLVPACAGAAQRGQALADTVAGSTVDPADTDPADTGAALVETDPVASSQDGVASAVQAAAAASAPAPSDRPTAVERALADGDICGVYDGLTNYDIAATSAQRFVAQLATIRDTMAGAASIVNDDLRADWDVMTEATGDVVTALNTDPFAMEAAAHVYDDPAYQAAEERVETWMDDNWG